MIKTQICCSVVDTLNQPGHFDLLLTSTPRKTYPLSRSVQDIVNEQEQTCREPERSLAFKVILDPSITNYWSATSYIELGQSSPSTDRLKTHAASSISRQESHPEVSTRGSESHSGQGTPDVHSDSPLTDIGLVIGKVITDKDKYSLLTSHWTPDVLYKFPSHMEYGKKEHFNIVGFRDTKDWCIIPGQMVAFVYTALSSTKAANLVLLLKSLTQVTFTNHPQS